MVLHQAILTYGYPLGQADIQSDVPPGRGIWWPGAILHPVILTFGHPLGQADIRSNIASWLRHLMAKNGTKSVHLDIWSSNGSD